MPSLKAMLLSFSVAAAVVVALPSASVAQNPGDPVTVQAGSYLSPTAVTDSPGFQNSYNCYPWTTPAYQGCDVETRVYSADLFASAVATDQAMEITSFTFFSASAHFANIFPNYYSVFLGTGDGPLTLFGRFQGGNPVCGTQCSLDCGPNPSLTCMPEGAGATGSYLYDPTLGDLTIKMVETNDRAVGWLCCYWYENGELVTRFDGKVVATPEPSTIVLVGSGFVAILGISRRRRVGGRRAELLES